MDLSLRKCAEVENVSEQQLSGDSSDDDDDNTNHV
jgi:hypothetical protein